MNQSLGALGLGLALAAGPVAAADVSVSQYDEDYADGPGAYIVISGETLPGDYERFIAALPEAIAIHGSRAFPIDIWLEGPGGDLDVALKLGELIYDLGFATLVDQGTECVSACALLWLSGARLYMVEGAQIGFHQSYEGDGEASIVGNARVGFHLSRVGLEANVVDFVMSASPEDVRWLDPSLAETVGIPFSMLTP